MNITPILNRFFFNKRYKAIQRYSSDAESIQRKILKYLVSRAAGTRWGKEHGYATITSYEQFARNVPASLYDDMKDYIQRMRMGGKDILWPGRVQLFASTSGTTSEPKIVPVTREGLKDIHFRGGRDSLACYLHINPKSRIFSGNGRNLILGGHYIPDMDTPCSVAGDLSAILIDNVPLIVKLARVPDRETALSSDFEEKRERIATAAKNMNVTNISGATSWVLNVMKHTMEVNGTDSIDEIWPNLEVLFHGGMSFAPYKEQFRDIIHLKGMHYMETYNASEGFFGIQTDPEDPAMTLMIDYKVFYEFCPLDNIDDSGRPVDKSLIVPLWNVETDRDYAMLISTDCGLWRYVIGDTVRFTRKNPYKFVITGRTKHFIDVVGERLYAAQAEKSLLEACDATGALVREYTVAPDVAGNDTGYRHQWIIEFDRRPGSVEEFASSLDSALQSNDYSYNYERHRASTLQKLEIIEARSGLFEDWLKSKDKLGGQNKVPHLSNSRRLADELIAMNLSASSEAIKDSGYAE